MSVSEALSANYMQADLFVRIWQATKSDRDLSDELADAKGADRDSARVVKKLLTGNRELKDCVQAYTRVRTWFYANTLCMGKGMYVVPVTNAMNFLSDFDKLKREANDAKQALIDSYDSAVEDAKRHLGNMFDASNYPNKHQLHGMFGCDLGIRPVPAVNDYDRLAIPGKLAAGLKDLYSRAAESQVESAVTDLQQRMLDELDRMATQFGKVAKGEKTRLYKSLITNMQGLVALARGLHAIDDGRLSALADDIEGRLLANKLDDYRDNVPLASAAATAAAELRERTRQATPAPSVDSDIDKLVAEIDNDEEEDDLPSTDGEKVEQVTADMDFNEVYY